MQVEQLAFLQEMARMCDDAWRLGWHERNAGNLSYRLTPADALTLEEAGGCSPCSGDWQPAGVEVPELANGLLCISGAGRCFRNAASRPSDTFGVIQVSEDGGSYRVVWGLEGCRPTSELPTHLLAHAARMRAFQRRGGPVFGAAGEDRVVYHAHCPNVIALSNILPPESRAWTRALWKAMTEAVLFFPDGLGVLPWMVPGGNGIARASEGLLEEFPACVWTQHGLFTTGASFDGAFGLAHMIEKTAGIYLSGLSACGGKEPPFCVGDGQLRTLCRESGAPFREDFLDPCSES